MFYLPKRRLYENKIKFARILIDLLITRVPDFSRFYFSGFF
jgi:hypothetical protein